MIKYDPNRWATLIFNRYSRKTYKKTLPNTISIVIYTSVFSVIYELFFREHYDVSPVVHSLLGIVLGLFLVFRTNTAYDKWWEGRKIWGALVNDSRNLALKFNAFIGKGERDLKKYIAELQAAYVVTMKDHLRDEGNLEFTELSADLKKEGSAWNHKPNFVASKLYEVLNRLFREEKISGDQMFILDKEIKGLTDHVGACERIKNTPIPYSYSMYIKKFIFIYSVTLPFGLVSTFHYWTIAVTLFVFYFLVTVELIAEEIEEPFGKDENDLPTDELAVKIGENVREILLNSE